jgi:2-polyprenyl-6-methoxyphenol hydroxylase-like FAD-dependent oxidoreductase
VKQLQASVLVVGAGPAGLTLACELHRHGVKTLLVERLEKPAIGSKGKGLQPRTLEIFDDLGIVDGVLAAGMTYPKVRSYNNGSCTQESEIYPIQEPSSSLPYPNTIMLPQWKTEALLRERLIELGGAILFETELTQFSESADGISATLMTPRGARRVDAKFIVGADGGHSTVRKALGIPLLGDAPNLRGVLVADVKVEGLERDFWHFWHADNQPTVALCPLPSTDHFQFYAMLPPHSQPEQTLDAVRSFFEGTSLRKDLRLHDLSWISFFKPNVRMAQSYRSGSAFLVGDAAHVHPPTGGQGLNTSVQDAYNLGWKLAAVLNGADPSLLDTYQDERLPIAAGVLQRSEALYRIEVDGDRQAPISRGKSISQLDLNYRNSALSVGAAPGTIQPGDRMADRALRSAGQTQRLFDLMRGPHATVLAVSVPAIPARAGVRVVEVESARADMPEEERLPNLGYVVIRPDGYVGTVTSDPEAVVTYLDRILPEPTPGCSQPSVHSDTVTNASFLAADAASN